MRITVMTLFAEMFDSFLQTSIVGRSLERGLASVDFVNYRDFAHDNYRHVDDTPFGGGNGMVMKCAPVMEALDSIRTEDSYVIMMNPAGTPLNQKKVRELAQKKHLVIMCGHYEGMDARIENHIDECISIGDYVLTGGEPAAMIVMDSVIRLLPGAIKEGSADDESYENGLLEYPQYTQPADFNGEKVPEVLLSGNHAKIKAWRLYQSLERTKKIRPDLYDAYELSKEEKKLLKKYGFESEKQ